MTVINLNSISGITSITLPSGDGNVLTIHTNDGTERFRIDSSGNVKVGSAATISPDGDLFVTGVCTATTLSGAASGLTGTLPAISGANLTNLPAANITGTLPAISATNLTNVPAANITGTLPAIDGSNLTGIGGTDFIHAEQISVSGITTSNYFVPTAGQLGGRRNIVINGACMVAQRGTSSTSSGYLVDRHKISYGNLDESPTMSQHTLTSSDTGPYEEGFRYSFQIQNGNQTSGLGSSDEIEYNYRPESQTMAQCGWNYKSSSSFITLSFWCKSSVAQNFYASIRTPDGTSQNYSFETGSLTADTWTKVTKTIPGNSNLTFDDNVELGWNMEIAMFMGTDDTDSGNTMNQWAAYNSSNQMPDNTPTWYTTNSATWEITGMQLEVGDTATSFEHRSFGEELLKCYRYYYRLKGENNKTYMIGMSDNDNVNIYGFFNFPVEMRIPPTSIEQNGTASHYKVRRDTTKSCTGVPTYIDSRVYYCRVNFPSSGHGWGTGQMLWCQGGNSSSYIGFPAEL